MLLDISYMLLKSVLDQMLFYSPSNGAPKPENVNILSRQINVLEVD